MKCTLLMTTIVAAFLSLNVAACAATPRQLQAAAVYIKVEGIGKDNKPQSWSGSGVCILSGGWVITNEHVAPGTSGTANTIRVFFNPSTPDEFSSAAEVVATHPDRDLALLKCRVNHEPATLRLGRTEQIELTDAVQVVGFPFGDRVSEDRANPSVTIVGGTVSALRKGEGGRLHCIDVAAPVAGGNSGSALVDREGLLIGIITQKYEGFARAIPVEYVQELLGQAAFDVALEPGVAPDAGGEIRVIAKPQGPAAKLILGECRVENGDSRKVTLTSKSDYSVQGIIRVPPKTSESRLPVTVRVTTDSGFTFEQVIGVKRVVDSKIPIRAVIHSITLKETKANGSRWDVNAPDPFVKIYNNGVLIKQTVAVQNQFRILEATPFDCDSGDAIQIVVFDKDVAFDDLAGEISFVAQPNSTIAQPTTGQLRAHKVTVRAVPLRLPVAK